MGVKAIVAVWKTVSKIELPARLIPETQLVQLLAGF